MQTTDLWTRYKEHDDAGAREALIVRYSYLVRCAADRLGIAYTPYMDRDDILSHGTVGLIDAVEKYDHQRGPRFESYAGTRIRGAILDAVRAMDWLPRSVRSTAATVERTALDLQHSLRREASLDELAAATGLAAESIEATRARVETGRMASLEALMAPDEHDSSSDALVLLPLSGGSDEAWPSPARSAEQSEERRILIEAIGTLSEDEKLVLSLYYFEDLTLKEIGQVMTLTESRISQIHTKAVGRLRSALQPEAEFFAVAA